MHDMQGIDLGRTPEFVRKFMGNSGSVMGAIDVCAQAVKNEEFRTVQPVPGDFQ